ncbi:prevent-host-death family protein [Brucella pseudogrignonensis]|uniref:Prevent-host-death family protein n=2 Tax=Brucella/Ochrobactrum group TaxID=2826938 RepID=A0A256G7D6_9HYPH|nr:prevent-host-death family protein [Brucella pseudogrignonensis]
MVPADVYEDMLEKLDDIRLTEIIRKRADEKGISVDIDAL